MMAKAWSNIEEVPYCFSMSSVKFQGHTVQKTSILNQIGRFRTVTPVWILRWIWNDAQSLMLYRRGALLFFKVDHQISRSHGLKNLRFESNLSKIARPVAAKKISQICLVFIIMLCFMGNKTILTITDFQWNVNVLQCAEPSSRCSQVILLHVNISSQHCGYWWPGALAPGHQ